MPAGYYQKNKGKLQKGLVKGIKVFLKKKKKTKCQYASEQYRNLPEKKASIWS